MPDHQFVLTLSCPDRPGIVSAVSTFLAHNGQNILDAQQFDDVETEKFFMRVVFTAADLAVELAALQTGFAAIADRFGMDWQMRDRASRRRVMLLVSQVRSLPGRYPLSLAHRRTRDDPDRDRLQPSARDLWQSRFRRDPVPLSAGHQGDQARAGSRRSGNWCRTASTDLVVLARYMQILSDEMSAQAVGPLHQHPPLVPAGLQGRAALSSGA